MKKNSSKVKKEWHAPTSRVGMGDYYGTGIKQKTGKMRENYMVNSLSPKKLGKPPKAMA